jgi:2-octaprenyl-6-methoxyphenol hydroxylase
MITHGRIMRPEHLNPQTVDVAVVGAGPAGLVAGLALAASGLTTAVVGPASDPRDGRSAALFQGSVDLLKRLGAWPLISAVAEPLDAIRLVDATGALFRAPEVTFRASEIGQDAFGYNVPNAALTAALEQLASGRLQRMVTPAVTSIDTGPDGVTLITQDGTVLSAKLIAAADGRNSPSRAAAAIATRSWRYDQAALVCTFAHARPHKNVSTEFHRRAGPLTVVPGPGQTSNLVWVDTVAEAERLFALSDADFSTELTRHISGLLGTLTQLSPRRMFPLSGQTAEPLAQNRIALIGEAGHVIPPIGAQGLNLGFRDAAMLAEIATEARDSGVDIGSAATMQRYDAARRPDVTSRVWTVDVLNRSLLSSYAPVHMLRGMGLFALSTLPPLRQRIMREGMAPAQSTPKLMQPMVERAG